MIHGTPMELAKRLLNGFGYTVTPYSEAPEEYQEYGRKLGFIIRSKRLCFYDDSLEEEEQFRNCHLAISCSAHLARELR